MNKFAEYVRRYMRHNDAVSMNSLAKDAGLSASTLMRIRDGRSSPTLETAIRLAKAMGTTIGAIIDRPMKAWQFD